MKTNRKKTLIRSAIVLVAVASMGAVWSARTMLEIGPTATVTASFPEIQLLDNDFGDTDWEIEADGDRLQIGTNGTVDESVRIYSGASEDSLVVGDVGVGIGVDNSDITTIGADLLVGGIGGSLVLQNQLGGSRNWGLLPFADVFTLVASDETGTNGSIPFAISEEAPNGSLGIFADGNILLGGAFEMDPDASVHVFRDDGTASFKVEEASPSASIRTMMELTNNGGVRFALDNLDRAERWFFSNNTLGDFIVSRAGTGGNEMSLSRAGRFATGPAGFLALDSRPNGNLFIGGTLFESSDKNKKENFAEVDCREVLDQVVNMPVTTWNYKTDDESIRHMGPVAQDFRSAFELGESDTTISTTDKFGVSLAAIKALNAKLQEEVLEKDEELEDLKSKMGDLLSRLEAVEANILNQ